MEKENKKTIEIPFGAKDSELYKFEYTIPEGYEAEIKDGKVLVTKKESEDERIKKSLVEFFRKFNPKNMWDEVFSFGDVLSYLEKQKEQKPFTPKYRVGEVMRTKQEAAEGITDGLPVIVSMDDNYYYCTNEKIPISKQEEYEFPPMNMRQKPAEWSLTDATFIEEIDETLFMAETGINEVVKNQIERERNWLNSLPGRFNLQPKPEWSEEDKEMLRTVIYDLKRHDRDAYAAEIKWLKCLDERFNLQPKQEWSEEYKEPMEIRFAGKVYKVHGIRVFPGGKNGYIIEDEPGHYDCITNPDEVLGYGIKGCGSPYPTKEANFGQLHWKPSEEQMKAILDAMIPATGNTLVYLNSLYEQLKSL